MSKIKASSIEALSNNTDLTITPNGTGVFEVANDTTDGTLELNSISNLSSVKIQAPPATASQDYSLILPDSDMAVDKYLKVSSITGSGSTAVGQLGYDNITTPSLDLDAAQITSGTVPIARVPSAAMGADKGLSLAHVQTQTIPQSSFVSGHGTIQDISVTGLEENTIYRFHGKLAWSTSDHMAIQFLDASGTNVTASNGYIDYMCNAYNLYDYSATYATEIRAWNYGYYSQAGYGNSFIAELHTTKDKDWFNLSGFEPNTNSVGNQKITACMTGGYTKQIHGIRFYMYSTAPSGTGGFLPNSTLTTYKYIEA